MGYCRHRRIIYDVYSSLIPLSLRRLACRLRHLQRASPLHSASCCLLMPLNHAIYGSAPYSNNRRLSTYTYIAPQNRIQHSI